MNNHTHNPIPQHLPNTSRRFFALARELGHESEEAKSRACKKFDKKCFNDLTDKELRTLNSLLSSKVNYKEYLKQQSGVIHS